jgi:transposase InsO family protein
MKFSIKLRPIKPGPPHLNGKVERSQKTVFDEFYFTIDLKSSDLEDQLQQWQHFYSWNRPHGSNCGLTPMHKIFQVIEKTHFWSEIMENYETKKEELQE